MKALVDGVFFQLARPGIARVWSSALSRLAEHPDVEIVMLDRGGCPDIPSVRRIAFPSYTGRSTAADSFLIEQIGSDVGADVFMSNYYATPVEIPSVLVVHDMTPEALGFIPSERTRQEREIAIAFARRFVCVSSHTRADLLSRHPEIPEVRAIVTHCGIERSFFHPYEPEDIQRFKKEYGLDKPYFVQVGSRERQSGDKHDVILSRAIKRLSGGVYDIVSVGGESESQKDHLEGLPDQVPIKRVDLRDEALARAYAGAEALVFPSLDDGFGMPVIEAMACGCPVITNRLGLLGEVAADAAEFVSDGDVRELAQALLHVREPKRRSQLVERGYARTRAFSWDVMTEELHEQLKIAAAERANPSVRRFFGEWKRLRTIQAAVDVS